MLLNFFIKYGLTNQCNFTFCHQSLMDIIGHSKIKQKYYYPNIDCFPNIPLQFT